MLIITNPYVMAQVLGILVLVVLPSVYFARRIRKLSRASQDRVADTSAIAAEVLNAIPVVQSYTQETREAQRFDESTENAFGTAVNRTRMRAVLVGFIITATFGALLWGLYQGTQAVVRGDITAGHLGQTVFFVIILVSGVAVLAEVYGDMLRAAGATERLMELLATESPIASPAAPRELPLVQRGSSVSLEAVTFNYPSRPKTSALSDFNLAIAPGETVALVGPSGAGKSTVLQLLLRFYDVSQGTVRIDGIPVRELALDALRGRIGIVPQDSVIFSADAMANIRYGRPEATDAEVREAASLAGILDFIDTLPEGFATRVGRSGSRLSLGQKQRVSIARALVSQRPVIVLDEPTAALDPETERRLAADLLQARRDRAVVVVAHRLSTIRAADQIVFLEDGRIRETGRHEDLVRTGGPYARFLSLQTSEVSLDPA